MICDAERKAETGPLRTMDKSQAFLWLWRHLSLFPSQAFYQNW